MSISSDQNVSILLLSNICNGNFSTFWRRHTWRLGIDQNLCEHCLFFLRDFSGPKCLDNPYIHSTTIQFIGYIIEFWTRPLHWTSVLSAAVRKTHLVSIINSIKALNRLQMLASERVEFGVGDNEYRSKIFLNF